MNSSSVSVLQSAALESGLLSASQLRDALSGLSAESPSIATGSQHASTSDEQLAHRLVELGYLNRWQVDQLLLGYTKFQLGPYKIVDAIGKGGMGHVFKGQHELLGRIEAVKVLPASKTTPESIANFRREIRVQSQLDHPNLVRVSYADHDGDTHFFVTEYVPGTDLRRLVRRHGPLPMGVAASIIVQVATGLQYAHRKGLVHRDLKPGNVLVTPDGLAKITDLGLAWYLLDDIGPVVGGKPGVLVGTSDYLAPETIAHPELVRPISDIYSLGCTLYYIVTGKVPFPGGTTAEKIRRHVSEAPLNPLHFNPGLSPKFCELLAQLMEKDPDKRIPTAEKVAELLQPWCSEDLATELAGVAKKTGTLITADVRQSDPVPPGLAETATFEVDEVLGDSVLDSPAQPVDSPSQISQGTNPLSAASEDTVPHPPESPTDPALEIEPTHIHWGWKLCGAIVLAAVMVWALRFFGLGFWPTLLFH